MLAVLYCKCIMHYIIWSVSRLTFLSLRFDRFIWLVLYCSLCRFCESNRSLLLCTIDECMFICLCSLLFLWYVDSCEFKYRIKPRLKLHCTPIHVQKLNLRWLHVLLWNPICYIFFSSAQVNWVQAWWKLSEMLSESLCRSKHVDLWPLYVSWATWPWIVIVY